MAFIYIVVLVRLFGPEGTGLYSFVTTNLVLLTIIMGLNYKQSLSYFVASERIRFAKILTISIYYASIVIGIYVFMVLLLYLFRGEWLSIVLPENLQELPILVYAIVYFIAHILTFVVEGILIGLTRFDKLNRIELFNNLIKVAIFSVLYAFKLTQGIEFTHMELFLWLIGIELVMLLLYIIYFLRIVALKFDFKDNYRDDLKTLRRYSLQGYFTQNASYLVKRIDIWFIEFYNGLAALGNYSLANQITNFLLEFIFPINKVMMPYLTKMEVSSRQKFFFIGTSLSFSFMLFFAIGIIGFAGIFIPFIFGLDFADTIMPARILSIAVVLLIVRNNMRLLNNVYDRQKFSVFGSSMELLIIIFLDILWIPKYGIIGAAYATLCAYLAGVIFLIYTARPVLEFPIYRLFVPKTADVLLVRKKGFEMSSSLFSQIKSKYFRTKDNKTN